MTVESHIAILCSSSLAVPRANRPKPGRAPEPAKYYAQIAFPPTAANDLAAMASSIAPGGQLAGLQVAVYRNDAPMAGGQPRKPVPGIPGDWLMVRASTEYPVYLADAQGQQLVPGTPEANARIAQVFYAGKKVRAGIGPWAWGPNQAGQRGISFNLFGVMEVGDGERLAIGQGRTAGAFAQYAAPAPAGQPAPQQPTAPAPAASPFGGTAAPGTGAPNSNTFGGTAPAPAPAAGANPFAQAAPAPAAANPFAR